MRERLVFGAGTLLEHGYGITPQAVMRNNKISRMARLMYAYFCSVADTGTRRVFPGTDTAMRELGMNKDTFYKYLDELESLGLVYREQEHAPDGKFKRSVYFVPVNMADVERVKQAYQAKKAASEKTGHGESDELSTEPLPKLPDTAPPDTVKPPTIINSYVSVRDSVTPYPSDVHNPPTPQTISDRTLAAWSVAKGYE